MHRTIRVLLLLPCLLAPVVAAQEAATPTTPAEAAKKRIGFYFGLTLTKLSQQGQANGIGFVVDPPVQPGFPFPVSGDQVDADFNSRLNLEFMVGFRLRDAGNVEATFLQWDEKQDLLRVAPEGKVIANALASPEAGYFEDVNGFGGVAGFNGGLQTELDASIDPAFDAAEDLNFNGEPDFIRFDTSNRIVGQLSTDYQSFDLDYRRTWKKLRRFTLDWRAGLRAVTLEQNMDLGYRDVGSFAVYVDLEIDSLAGPGCPRGGNVQDGDGDGFDTSSQNEADGDGFLDGDCDATIADRIESVETVSEDRIKADIKTSGYGLKFGVDGRFELTKKLRLSGSIGISAVQNDVDFRYRETFVSERDRFLNFIDWDLNHDGVYDNRDLDFDETCVEADGCVPNTGDNDAVVTDGVTIRTRRGVEHSIVSNSFPGQPDPIGQNPDAYQFGAPLRVGDAIGEAERNNEITREVRVLHDVTGSSSGISPILDIAVGLEYQFSKLAHVGFGYRSSRWFDAGSFRSLANDVVAGKSPEASGDFTIDGAYFTLTITPR